MWRNSTPDKQGLHSPTRRKLLQAGMLLIALVTTNVRDVFAHKQANNGEDAANYLRQHLQQLARRLFPHDQLSSAPYEEIADAVVNRAAADTKLAAILRAGVARLNEGSLTPWLMRDEAQQLAAIKQLEASEFFGLMRTATIEHLYRNGEVWRLLGYQGSSVEFGGYVDRGFDDIDWLPAAGKAQ